MIIKFFVYSIYYFLKSLVIIYQRLYFPDTKIINRQGLDFSGPAIIVSNHPNTMLDPLHIISRTPRHSFFLANASMFKNPLASRFLNHFCIPIHRPGRDNNSIKVDNRSSFSRSYQHLEKGGVIYIAPEGTSEMERHLRPVKTGTARISLGAENEKDFKLGVQIIPVGLNYEHPNQCGSRLLIKVGEPILVSNWENEYRNNPKSASLQMTEELEKQMQLLLIHTDDKEQDQFLYRLESILQNDHPLGLLDHHDRTQKLLKGLQGFKQTSTEEYEHLREDAHHYRFQIKANGLTDRGISAENKNLLTAISILGWPFWLYGRINNWLAIEIPRWLVGKLDLYIGYTSTVKILSGLFTFPISYFIQYKIVTYFFGQAIAWYYLRSLPIATLLYFSYQKYITPRVEAWKWRKWKKKEPEKASLLLNSRQKLKEKAVYLSA